MISAIKSQVHKAIKQIRLPLNGLIARGGSKTLQVKGHEGEVLQDIELIQQIGFNSYIPDGAKVVVIPLQGKTSKSIVIGTAGGTVVVNVGEGETCVYDQFGHHVLLRKNGIQMKGDVEIIGGGLTVEKGIQSQGDVSDKTGSMQQMRVTYNIHLHGNSPLPSKLME
ncbi:hypothetical protein F892_03123 [Acinetobacter vivianii]|uniref:Bacteriophage Mu Gp45 N-terminal domain-containing protein n=1 Tax=Acinetobacter vivianii TaxID=1776742 RepID=N9Q148_9GAMM|nr:phage baseplate assembly protein [Acinetobacter vivianii]ENX20200.1 hypothetical protein F892_03123 [Acinetobacter vivianii]GGI59352.1 hypothetical protein GCM10011446_08470 [Acinetobacter vivianii]